MLVLLYYLSQNPDFPKSLKPLMGQLKNSEQMLGFLNELSKFTQTFSAFKNTCSESAKNEKTEYPTKSECKNEKTPQSPTTGIADEFIQQILDSYLQKHSFSSNDGKPAVHG